jgi:hypothetical protein
MLYRDRNELLSSYLLVSGPVGESSTLSGHAKQMADPRGITLSRRQPFTAEESLKVFNEQALHYTPRFQGTFPISRVASISMSEA